jgi:hypothetical protein
LKETALGKQALPGAVHQDSRLVAVRNSAQAVLSGSFRTIRFIAVYEEGLLPK